MMALVMSETVVGVVVNTCAMRADVDGRLELYHRVCVGFLISEPGKQGENMRKSRVEIIRKLTKSKL